MEISIAIESGVLNHEGGAVPPPVIEVVPGVLAFEYKWLVACHPYVTKVRLPNDLSVSKRQEIEQIIGNLELAFSIKVSEDSDAVFACLSIDDMDNVLMAIFSKLEEDTGDVSAEVSYLGKTIRFDWFECVKSPKMDPPSDWIVFSANPAVRVCPYLAWKLKLESIQDADFRVTITVSVGEDDSCSLSEDLSVCASTDDEIDSIQDV